ncbi:carbohydrate-selective porin, OprB family protein [Novosphingobium sp. Rr 2-17]|uniref:carbohydrate porin n=1 Tax=Novosphingobium sp. Rr 2-17 TaxID=555793 RepID=UPI000269A494|nr:carbohydrate porin [Novosphingobium sp. Rr 2-17]EIZ80887.1 carbohydrate-selective porin, OprB family protein [Novosphingobium sp. Rr 2-17]
MKSLLLCAACWAGVTTFAPAAFAQEAADPATDAPLSTAPADAASGKALPAETPAAKAPSWQPLADQGITLSLSYTGEAATNVTGGLRKDAAYAGQVYVGADLDMNTIAGIEGGTIHAAITNRHGQSLSAIALGNNTSVQEIYGTQNTHLAILTWEQKLLDGRLDIEAGRSQANIYFLNSPLYCNFQSNSACGNPTFVFKNSNFTYFPASSWMARAKVSLTDKVWVHAGVFEVNPDRKRATDDGFNLSTKNATGVIVPWELGYGTDFTNDRLPRHYIVGGWFDRGDYSDPLRDDQGGIAVLTGRPAATRHGRSGIYFRFDQMLTRPDPRSERGLSLFGVAMTNLSGDVEESHYLELGLLQTGTFAGRDKDTLGFVINDQRFSDLAMERMRAARVSAGGTGDIARHQYMMELAYGAQIGPAVRLSPNIQYIIHPDQTSVPFRTKDIPDAVVLGFKFTVDANALLGGHHGS